ncbi:hypothetical protein TNCV_3496491 [Trichonephila clavipes]|nr:hypothetical protein TNCV_3496491 [Trichonephila clavipes]
MCMLRTQWFTESVQCTNAGIKCKQVTIDLPGTSRHVHGHQKTARKTRNHLRRRHCATPVSSFLFRGTTVFLRKAEVNYWRVHSQKCCKHPKFKEPLRGRLFDDISSERKCIRVLHRLPSFQHLANGLQRLPNIWQKVVSFAGDYIEKGPGYRQLRRQPSQPGPRRNQRGLRKQDSSHGPRGRSLGRRGQESVPTNLPDHPVQFIVLDMLYPMHFAHLRLNVLALRHVGTSYEPLFWLEHFAVEPYILTQS